MDLAQEYLILFQLALGVGFSKWRELRRDPAKRRQRVQPRHLWVVAVGCFAAAIILYIGSCLYPKGGS